MATSPEAKVIAQRDRDYRDAQHQGTLAKEAGRKAAEPVNGAQPGPRKTRPQAR